MKNINILIIDKLNGRLTPEQDRYLSEWINTSEENLNYYYSIKEIVKSDKSTYELRFNSKKAFDKFNQKHHVNNSALYKRLMKYAAIFIVFFSVAGLGYNYIINSEIPIDEYEVVYVPAKKKKVIYLSDGTKVTLNSKSTFRYPSSFRGDARNVILEGEAFFEVTKNKEKPFFVNTSQFSVEVLGTSFNVSAYKDDELFSTALLEGLVKINLKKENQSILIKPNQQIVYNKSIDELNISEINVNRITQWLNNVLAFENEKLSSIVRKLERWYDVEIITNNINVDSLKFTCTFEDKTIDEVMNIMKKISDSQCKIEQNKIQLYK